MPYLPLRFKRDRTYRLALKRTARAMYRDWAGRAPTRGRWYMGRYSAGVDSTNREQVPWWAKEQARHGGGVEGTEGRGEGCAE